MTNKQINTYFNAKKFNCRLSMIRSSSTISLIGCQLRGSEKCNEKKLYIYFKIYFKKYLKTKLESNQNNSCLKKIN